MNPSKFGVICDKLLKTLFNVTKFIKHEENLNFLDLDGNFLFGKITLEKNRSLFLILVIPQLQADFRINGAVFRTYVLTYTHKSIQKYKSNKSIGGSI